jgi:hypothetical protein
VYGGKTGTFEVPTAVESELTTVSPRPSSLGFSDHDLRHFAGFYATLAEAKVSDWKQQNQKVLHQDSPNKGDVEERDRRYMAVKVVRTILGVLTAELGRREAVRLSEAREYEAAREALRASLAASSAAQAVEVEEATKEVAEIKLKVPNKHRGPSATKTTFKKVIKSEGVDNPFSELKGELTSRTRESWTSRSIKKSEALTLAGVSEDELDQARQFAQRMGTDEVLETSSGVIRLKKSGASVRYEYFGA